MATIMARTSQAKTTFLDLPGEIRNQIYDMYMASQGPVIVYSRRNPVTPALLRTSSQIRDETKALYWSGSTFVFVSGCRLNRHCAVDEEAYRADSWLRAAGATNIAMMTRIQLRWDHRENPKQCFLKHPPGKQHVNFHRMSAREFVKFPVLVKGITSGCHIEIKPRGEAEVKLFIENYGCHFIWPEMPDFPTPYMDMSSHWGLP